MTTGLRSQLQLSPVILAGYFPFCSPGTLSSEMGTVQSGRKALNGHRALGPGESQKQQLALFIQGALI